MALFPSAPPQTTRRRAESSPDSRTGLGPSSTPRWSGSRLCPMPARLRAYRVGSCQASTGLMSGRMVSRSMLLVPRPRVPTSPMTSRRTWPGGRARRRPSRPSHGARTVTRSPKDLPTLATWRSLDTQPCQGQAIGRASSPPATLRVAATSESPCATSSTARMTCHSRAASSSSRGITL